MLPPFFYTARVSKPGRPEERAVYLIGMMGVGKSTIGARLAARLGRRFLDTDREVERIAGRTIAEIFASDGEAHFRRLEAEAIEEATTLGAVIALGGGAVMAPGAMEKLSSTGDTVFLVADPELLAKTRPPRESPA